MNKPFIAITMGDPAGVGPEVCLHALNHVATVGRCIPVVFGDAAVLGQCGERVSLNSNFQVFESGESLNLQSVCAPTIIHVEQLKHDTFKPGSVDANTGSASFAYINRAIDAALAGQVAAVTTAPINKEALALANIQFPGHTEIFADRAGSDRWCMMQYSEEITCTFATVHVGYADVPELLSTERVLEVIELSAENLERIRSRKAKVVVCGLNPHAGGTRFVWKR